LWNIFPAVDLHPRKKRKKQFARRPCSNKKTRTQITPFKNLRTKPRIIKQEMKIWRLPHFSCFVKDCADGGQTGRFRAEECVFRGWQWRYRAVLPIPFSDSGKPPSGPTKTLSSEAFLNGGFWRVWFQTHTFFFFPEQKRGLFYGTASFIQ